MEKPGHFSVEINNRCAKTFLSAVALAATVMFWL
jgi:hypothetical protein